MKWFDHYDKKFHDALKKQLAWNIEHSSKKEIVKMVQSLSDPGIQKERIIHSDRRTIVEWLFDKAVEQNNSEQGYDILGRPSISVWLDKAGYYIVEVV